MSKDEAKAGRQPERLRIQRDWKDAMKRAIEKPKPDGGWPVRPKRSRTKKKSAK